MTRHCEQLLEMNTQALAQPLDLDSCDFSSWSKKYDLKTASALRTRLGLARHEVLYWDVEKKHSDNSYIRLWKNEQGIQKMEWYKTIEDVNLLAKLTETLGAPATKLDYFFGIITMKEKAWIYPEKGIALFWGMTDTALYRVSYFRPTSLVTYIETLHPMTPVREFRE